LIGYVIVSSTRSRGVGIVRLLNLIVNSLDKPHPLPDRKVIAFVIAEAHVVHQEKDLFEVDLFVARRQAKKTWRPVATVPPNQ